MTFTLDAYGTQVFRGRVARIDPTADPGTRQVGVYVRLPNPEQRIVGGQYARGRIETGSGSSNVVIPESAVANRTGDSAQVFVVVGNKLARRTVQTGVRDEASGTIAVLSGIQAGERVLLNPSNDIVDGASVSVAADSAAAAKPANSER